MNWNANDDERFSLCRKYEFERENLKVFIKMFLVKSFKRNLCIKRKSFKASTE